MGKNIQTAGYNDMCTYSIWGVKNIGWITAILRVNIKNILPNLQIPDIFVYSASDFLTVKNVKSYESKSDRSIVQNERSQSTAVEWVEKIVL